MTALFKRFALAAKEEGAIHNPEVCRGRELAYKDGGTATWTTGCGGESKFYLPVEGDDFKKPEPAKVCVVDDMAYAFPRYGG